MANVRPGLRKVAIAVNHGRMRPAPKHVVFASFVPWDLGVTGQRAPRHVEVAARCALKILATVELAMLQPRLSSATQAFVLRGLIAH
jgi:hypothetical protein